MAAFAFFARGGEASEVKRTMLPNGMVLLTKPVTTNSIVSVAVSRALGMAAHKTAPHPHTISPAQSARLKNNSLHDSILTSIDLLKHRIACMVGVSHGPGGATVGGVGRGNHRLLNASAQRFCLLGRDRLR